MLRPASPLISTMPTARTNGNDAFLSHIPIIDISESDKDIPAKLVDAAATYGFVYIKSVGLDFTREIIDHVFALVCLLPYFPARCHQLMSMVVTETFPVAAR